jgi:carbamoyl-phosphate synthase large subunit
MPKKGGLSKIAVLGAGPITIGQACEFDYSGTQACQALREEGCEVLLINSNPATIMTDPLVADHTYIEPMNWETVSKILRKERPDAILATMGGQTALNCLRELHKHSILKDLDIECLGVTPETIESSESRAKFKGILKNTDIDLALSQSVRSMVEAKVALVQIKKQTGRAYPTIIRPSFTLGGIGGGVAHSIDEFEEICESGLKASPTSEVLIEESLLGWKEFEVEVVKDEEDNFIAVCTIENVDPMGIHTGDSATVAPAQTLTDQEYQLMRRWSFQVVRQANIRAGCVNVQLALCPQSSRLVVIEMNPRVSRSSALASKATGFPIARVSAKLSLGYSLEELRNRITANHLAASFEPTVDYVVVKLPKFSFEKFPGTIPVLSTQMQSVGEVMGIGRTFGEACQKAVRSLDNPITSLTQTQHQECFNELVGQFSYPNPNRLFLIVRAFKSKAEVRLVFQRTCIDRWFLEQLKWIARAAEIVTRRDPRLLSRREWFIIKQFGLSDSELSSCWGIGEDLTTLTRRREVIRPTFKRIDACAAEFGVRTAYLYSSYEEHCEAAPSPNEKVLIIGSGPNRIGQGLEFDYCCVHSAQTINRKGLESIMVNCNPETVSTDYDVPTKLYFEPLTLEDVEEVAIKEQPKGVVVQLGGQTPLKLSSSLERRGQCLLGTGTQTIERAESREQFKRLLDGTTMKQPDNSVAFSKEQAVREAQNIGLPIIIRPSFVLGGSFMRIVRDLDSLEVYTQDASSFLHEGVLVERFLEDAIEFDVDCVCDGDVVILGGIMEHVEQAGIHSGDSACSLPPHSMSSSTLFNLEEQVKELAKTLKVVGLMNVQFAIQDVGTKDEEVYVLEVNPRASRTVPFISKATRMPLIRWATEMVIGPDPNAIRKVESSSNLFAVKESVFPFTKFPQTDCLLGPEMRSTGEVMGIGRTFGEAWSKSQMAVCPASSHLTSAILSSADEDKTELASIGRWFVLSGLPVLSASRVISSIKSRGLRTSNNIALHYDRLLVSISGADFKMRREAQKVGIVVCSTIRGALAFVLGLSEQEAPKIVRLSSA